MIDHALARRLELAEARGTVDYAQAQTRTDPDVRSAYIPVDSGWAVWAGRGSPLSRAVGLGMAGPVTGHDLDRVEEFFLGHGETPMVDLCPFAHPSLLRLLGSRGYNPLEFMNAWALPLSNPIPLFRSGGVDVRAVAAGEEDLWTLTVTQGFSGRDEVSEDQMAVSRPFPMSSASCFLAWIDGQPAGGGAVIIDGGLATLFGDSTRIGFRRRGVQTALIAVRLDMALAAGCDLVTAQTVPGSDSERNIQRAGLSLAYTKLTMVCRG